MESENHKTIEQEYELLLSQYSNNKDANSYTGALMLLGGLVVIAVILTYIRDGVSSRMVFMLGLVMVMFIYYRFRINKEFSKVKASELLLNSAETENNLPPKLSYLNTGLDQKITRVRMVRLFYAVIFPVFLYAAKDLVHKDLTTAFILKTVPFVFLISYVVWSKFYSSEIKKLENAQTKIIRMNKSLNS